MIPEKYQAKGFHISAFGAGSLALKRNDRTVFVFSPASELDEELISVLCECNLNVFADKNASA
jgi:hypothetical protein